MTAPDSRFGYLYRQYISKSCTPDEMQEFFQYVRDPAYRQELEVMTEQHLETIGTPAGLPAIDWEHMYHHILQPAELSRAASVNGRTDPNVAASLHANAGRPRTGRVIALFTRRRVAAAVTIFVLCGGAYLYFVRQTPAPSPDKPGQPVSVTPVIEVAPGTNKAILTLAGGQQIMLDSAAAGLLAMQGNTHVEKLGDGKLAYQAGAKGATPLLNTLTTPRGGQFQLTLPDGTRVWLNAASSITYPTAFTGAQRTVVMTGEAYFEVAHDRRRLFTVKANGQTIEDIGTHFNVNAYTDEPVQTTTLLEGAVKVGGHLLKPGEKASVTASGNIRVTTGDPERATAWKNGFFDFSDADLPVVMRQMARWYNVDVKYEGDIPQRQFTGMIGRSLTLSQVLRGLTRERVNYYMEDKNHLIITP